MNVKKKVAVILSVIVGILIISGTVTGALYSQGSIRFLSQEGWYTDSAGNGYCLDYWGNRLTLWQQIDGNTYYFGENGLVQTGWLQLGDDVYYFDENGVQHHGLLSLESGIYYFDDHGLMQTGWVNFEEGTYYFSKDGTRHSGWLSLDRKKYYLDEQGIHTGWLTLDGVDYYFDENGIMCTGWLDLDGERYLLGKDGTKKTGWVIWSGDSYLLDENGVLVKGWAEVNGHKYYLDDNGIVYVGWLEFEGKHYYLKPSGIMAIGWLKLDGNRYYFAEDGGMVTGWQVIDGLYYLFQNDGVKALGQELADAVAERFHFGEECTIMLDRNNPLPADWVAYPIEVENGWAVDGRCYNQFVQMLADCRAAGNETGINSAYRSPEEQQEIWDNRVARYMDEGDSKEEAIARVRKEVAIPGYSEHQLGFAVDIDGVDAHDWMAENSWRYGFIIRYPEDKQEITGTVYEPWHVRFVGYELAEFMYEENLCLEEYYEIYG